MAGAPNAVTARIQAQVTTSSTSYVDITTTHGVLFGSRLKPSTTYLLVARGVVANQTAATGARVRLTRGGTAVPGSEQQFAIPVGRSRDYMFIQVYTTAGTPGDIKWQAMSSAGGSVTYLNEASLTCVELTGQTYQYNEDDDTGAPVLLTGGGATDTFASLDLGGQSGNWLVMSQIALDGGIADTGRQMSSILDKVASGMVFFSGFESGGMSAWNGNAGLTVQSGIVRSGQFAARGNTTIGNTYAKKLLPSTYVTGYAMTYLYITSMTDQINMLRVRDSADNSIAYLWRDTDGFLKLRNSVASQTTSSTVPLPLGQWHALEMRVTIAGASSEVEVWLNGTRINELSITTNLGTTNIGYIQIGEVQAGRTYDITFDDTAFSTSRITSLPASTRRTTLDRKNATTIPSSLRGWVGSISDGAATFQASLTEGATTNRWSHRYSNVFALKLDDIAGQSKFASPSDFSQTTASTWQQVSQVTLTNPSSTRYVVLGGANVDVNSSYNYYSRVQKDWTSGTDFTKTLHPEYDMSSTLKEHYPVQTTDRMMVAHGGVLVTRAGVSATVTHTGITTSSGAFPTTWRNPWLVAFPVNVGSGLVSPVAATDDGYSRSSLYSNSGATLYVGKVGSQNTGSWMRFPAMPVEQGSVVTGATLFVSKNLATDTTSGSPSALIRGEKAVNPSHPTTDADRLARTRTTASKVFDSGVWAGVAVGGYAGFDVKAIIQEIVDQESFAWGNAIQLFLDDNGSPSSTSWYAGQTREGGPLWPTLEVLVARVVPLGPTKGNKAKKGGGKATVLVKGRGSGRVAVTGLGVLSVEGGVPDSDSGVLGCLITLMGG